MFGTLHLPADEPATGVVVCGPLQAELLRNYRREVLLARRLAATGIAVKRFHYRGSGHSDGATSAVTLQTMVDDALAAAAELERNGVGRIAFMGTRWGAVVAARAAATRGAPLLMWEPVMQASRYFDEILRFRLMREINEDPTSSLVQQDLIDELHLTGNVDVLGHTLELSLFESAAGTSLAGLVDDSTSPALLVQIGVGRSLRKEYVALAAGMRSRGADVTTEVVVDREAWWISGDRWPVHETHPPTEKLVDATVAWATAHLTAMEPVQ
ncbi:MAG: serine aminopeptidase domain-containing protein [Actinomycetota bacterium]